MELKLYIEEPAGRIAVFKKWALRVGVAIAFIFIGKSKFAAHSEWVRIFARIGLGQWFRYFTGAVQIAGALLLLVPRTFAVGIALLSCTMLGAAAFWIFRLGDPAYAMIPVAILLGLLFFGGEDLIDLTERLRKR